MLRQKALPIFGDTLYFCYFQLYPYFPIIYIPMLDKLIAAKSKKRNFLATFFSSPEAKHMNKKTEKQNITSSEVSKAWS